jgi:hypothetical protein
MKPGRTTRKSRREPRRSDSEYYRGEGFRARYRRRICRNATGLLPRLKHERRGSMNREQIDVQIYLRGRLGYGISKQTRMVLAGDRIWPSLRRPVMAVTRWNCGRIRMRRRSLIASHTCRHAAYRAQYQEHRQQCDIFAQPVNHGLSLALFLRWKTLPGLDYRCWQRSVQ